MSPSRHDKLSTSSAVVTSHGVMLCLRTQAVTDELHMTQTPLEALHNISAVQCGR